MEKMRFQSHFILNTFTLVHSFSSLASSSFQNVGTTTERLSYCNVLYYEQVHSECLLYVMLELPCKRTFVSNIILYWTRALIGSQYAVSIAVQSHWCDRSCISFTPLLLIYAVHALVYWRRHLEHHTVRHCCILVVMSPGSALRACMLP